MFDHKTKIYIYSIISLSFSRGPGQGFVKQYQLLNHPRDFVLLSNFPTMTNHSSILISKDIESHLSRVFLGEMIELNYKHLDTF